MGNNINKAIKTEVLLPKKLETEPVGIDILKILDSHLKPVDQWKDLVAPSFDLSESIINSLHSARRTGRLIRGLEASEKRLNAEREGIANVDIKTGSQRKERVSRLIIIANDGSERFYRQVNKLVDQNRSRILTIHLEITSFELGERLFGPGKRVLFLLINHKEAVIDFLTSLRV